MPTFTFVKSSYSAAGGECVEVAVNIPDTVAVRDSKSPDRPIVRLTPAAWTAFCVATVATIEAEDI
nr:DUF397 domain-containing protein [Streptomyces sp. NBC_00857]